jgi:hypothetical protein
MATLFSVLKSFMSQYAKFSLFTALIHFHQLFKRNMHPNVLHSFFLPDNDGRTERLVQQLALRVV